MWLPGIDLQKNVQSSHMLRGVEKIQNAKDTEGRSKHHYNNVSSVAVLGLFDHFIYSALVASITTHQLWPLTLSE